MGQTTAARFWEGRTRKLWPRPTVASHHHVDPVTVAPPGGGQMPGVMQPARYGIHTALSDAGGRQLGPIPVVGLHTAFHSCLAKAANAISCA